MKFFALAVIFSVSLVQASTIKNNVTLSNVPKAAKSYEKQLLVTEDLAAARTQMEAECSKDLSETAMYLSDKGARLIKKTGCSVTVRELNGCDQGACPVGTFLSTSFEVLFL